MSSDWPLVGRSAQSERLFAAYQRTGCHLAVISAGAGVGKTRLADDLLARAAGGGAATARFVGTATMRDIPFGPFLRLLPTDGVGSGDVGTLLLLAARRLARSANGRPLVVGVDDAHLLDAGSGALVHHLAITGMAFVVVTLRAGEPVPEAVGELWQGGAADWLDLTPLAEAEVARLLATVLAGQVDGGAVRALHRLAAGNLVVLRELLAEARRGGALVHRSGLWQLAEPLPVPGRVQDMVPRRLAGLPADLGDLLILLAVEEPLDVGLAGRLVSATSLEQAEAAGLVTVTTHDRRRELRLAHPLYGEAARAMTTPLRTRRLRAALAGVFQAGPHRPGDLLRLALWHLDGVVDVDPATLVAAARQALAMFDYPLAARIADAARTGSVPFEAALIAAQARVWGGRGVEAEEILAGLAGSAGHAGSDERRMLVAVARGVNLFFGLGRAAEAIEVLRAAQREIHSPEANALVSVSEAAVLLRLGRPVAALDAAVVDRPGAPAPTARQRLHALPVLVSALAWSGRTAAAIEAGEWALADLDDAHVEFPYLADIARIALVGGYLLHGRVRAAAQVSGECYRHSLEYLCHERRGLWALSAGTVALARGRLINAVHHLREGVALLQRGTTLMGPTGVVHCASDLATALCQLGRAAEAEEALAVAAASLPPADCVVTPYALARAWVRAVRGDHTGAVEVAVAAAREAQAAGGLALAVRALHEALRFTGSAAVARTLVDLARQIDGPLVDGYATHAAAVADRNAALLAAAGDRFADLGYDLYAAEAFARAAGHARDRADAAAWRTRAAGLAADCDGARTPALATLSAAPTLSPREGDVARLAAGGMSNQAIADYLTVSVRTVESHLRSAFLKLGVTARSGLADALAGHRG